MILQQLFIYRKKEINNIRDKPTKIEIVIQPNIFCNLLFIYKYEHSKIYVMTSQPASAAKIICYLTGMDDIIFFEVKKKG